MRIKLQEVCHKITDGSHNPPKGIEQSDFLMLSSKNVFDDLITLDEPRYLSEEEYQNENTRTEIESDDLLMTIVGTVGRIAVVPKGFPAICLQRSVAVIKPDKSMVNSRYLMYQIRSMRSFFEAEAHGVAQKGIYLKQLSNVGIQCPRLDEQYTIASTLDKLQSIIAHRKQQLAKLDELVKARFVELFGEPIDNPMGWQIKPLKELSVLITNGNTPKGGSENYVDNGIIFLRSQNVWRNRIDLSDVAFIDEATNQKLKKSIVKHKDILITKTGRINTENSSLGRAALYLGEDDTANINGHVYLVRLKDMVVPEFVVTILTGEAYRKYIRKVCVGGIDKRQINLDQVEDFPIIMPPLEQQQAFADFSNQINKSKVAVQKALDEAQMLFDSLMQEYFG